MVENMSVQVSTCINENTKRQFDLVCERIGISQSNALSILITGVIDHNGIPFEITASPKKEYKEESATMKALNELSQAFEGVADDLGVKNDQDVVDMIKQMRKERRIRQNESNG